jgi:hypothetical protein
LNKLEFGNSVAESDANLENYFLETQPFSELVNEKKDIVAGDKGTGKTAIFRIVTTKYRDYTSLRDVEVVPAFNPLGSPVFQKLNQQDVQSEMEYGKLWKAYIFALVGNWLLGIYHDSSNQKLRTLDQILDGLELRTADDLPRTVFEKILTKIGSFFHWRKVEVEFTYDPVGKISVIPRLAFEQSRVDTLKEVPVEQALSLLNACLVELGHVSWVALDRLDEAFQGLPEVEVPALRALLRTYLDLNEFSHIKLKLFLRRDLFRRIVGTTFVNLSHINSKRIDVVWNDDDLKNLLIRRVRQNEYLIRALGENGNSDDALFSTLFPERVDPGSRQPRTWIWIMRRVRDGNDVKPPRNLIDLVSLARDEQLKKEGRLPREWSPGEPLLQADSLRAALEQLSSNRVQDTLLAESGLYARDIIAFTGGKAEHNETSISEVLNVDLSVVKDKVKPLVELGFLEYIRGTSTYKIPALYRFGLSVTQGKAFIDGSTEVLHDDED